MKNNRKIGVLSALVVLALGSFGVSQNAYASIEEIEGSKTIKVNLENGKATISAITNGKVELNNTGIVTGGAVWSYLNKESQAVGFGSTVGDHGAAYGYNNSAAEYATAVGVVNTAGDYATAVGYNNTSSGESSAAVGFLNKATELGASALGANNKANGEYSAALGTVNVVSGAYSAGSGVWNTVAGDYSAGMGINNKVYGQTSTAFGYSNTVGAATTEDDGTITVDTAKGKYTHVFGANNTVTANNAIVLGTGVTTVADNSVVIGNGSTSEDANTVSVGSSDTQRKIVHVAAGTTNTDAATYGQLIAAKEGGYSITSSDAKTAQSVELEYNDAASNSAKVKITVAGNGKVVSGDQRLVNGGTVYDAIAKSLAESAYSGSDTIEISSDRKIRVANMAQSTTAAEVTNGQTKASGAGALALGSKAEATGFTALAVGAGAKAMADGAVALGVTSQAKAANSSAIGVSNHAYAVYTAAVGYNNTTGDEDGTASNFATAMGTENTAIGWWSVALGASNTANATGMASAVGGGNTASAMRTAAMGIGNTASETGAVAMGTGNTASGEYASALGGYNTAVGSNSTAAGQEVEVYGANSAAFGYKNVVGTATENNDKTFTYSGGVDTYVFGANNTVAANNAIVLGTGVTTVADNSVVIGAGSTSEEANTVSVGAAATTKDVNGEPVEVAEVTRRIVHVAAGTTNTDAATYGQLIKAKEGGYSVTSSDAKTAQSVELEYNDADSNSTKVKITVEGDGKVESGDLRLVNGGTVYDAIAKATKANGKVELSNTGLLKGETVYNYLHDSTLDLGYANTVANGGQAFGRWNTVNADGAVAVGIRNTAQTSMSTAVGYWNEATGSTASAMGSKNTANVQSASAIGFWNDATALAASALGAANAAGGEYSSAVGVYNQTANTGSSAVGYANVASANSSSAFGAFNFATSESASAFGYGNRAAGAGSVAIGTNSYAAADKSIAIGYQAVANTGLTEEAGLTEEDGNTTVATVSFGHQKDDKYMIYDAIEKQYVERGYESTVLSRLTNVADGKWLTDAATYGQLVDAQVVTTTTWEEGDPSTTTTTKTYEPYTPDKDGIVTVKTNAGGTAFRIKVTGDATSYTGSDSITITEDEETNKNVIRVANMAQSLSRDGTVTNDQTTASGLGALALGYKAFASGIGALAVGVGNQAIGTYDVALGSVNKATGLYFSGAVGYGNDALETSAVAYGVLNQATQRSSVAMGAENHASGAYSSALGSHNLAAGENSTAAGQGVTVYGKNSSAFGYSNTVGAVLDIENQRIPDPKKGNDTYVFGANNNVTADKAVVVGIGNVISDTTELGAEIPVETNNVVLGMNNNFAANNALVFGTGITTVADNSVVIGAGSSSEEENTVSVGAAKTETAEELTRRIVHVAAGTTNSDAATYGQLVNNTTYELKVGKETEIKNNANETAFKLKVSLDSGSIVSGNAGYMTGGDLYQELRPASDGTYVKTGKSTATNLSALDTQVKANKDKIDTVEGNVTKLQGDVSTLDTKVSAMEGNITTMNTKIDGLKLDGGEYTFTKGNNTKAIHYANGGDAFTITIEDLGGEGKPYTEGNGIAINEETNEISVKVAENSGLTVDEKGLSVKLAENGGLTADDKGLAVQKDGVVESGNTGIVTGGTVHSAILAKTGDTTKLASAGLGDNLTDGVLAVNNKIGYLSDDINKVGAGAAALAALRPEAYDPSDKWSFAVGYGHYKNANSGALGVFFKPNEDTTVSFGGTVGNNDALMNAGVSFKLGTRSAKMGLYRTEAAVSQELASLRKNNDRLTADNQILKEDNIEQSKRIANLEANNERMQRQIVAILSRMGMLNRVSKTAK